jgi:hypothetical protein
MIAEHSEHWRVEWLRSRGLDEWADYLATHFPAGLAPVESMFAREGFRQDHEFQTTSA